MRVLIHDYAGHAFPVSLSKQLAERGHQVIHAFASQLLTPRGMLKRKEGDSSRLSFSAVRMSSDYRANKYSFIKRVGYERDYGHELVRLISELKPDLILSGQTPSDPQLMLIRASIKLGIPVVTWVQDFYSMAVDKLARKKIPIIGALAGAWYRSLDRQGLQASAGVVAITEDFIPILAGLGVPQEKITVIPNWAPLEEVPLRPRQNNWSTQHGLDDKFVFLYSGTLAMKHDPDLLRRLAIQFSDDPAVRLVVVSEGPGADYLQDCKMNEGLENLVLLPFQPFEVLPDTLATANVMVAVLESDAGVFSVPSKVLTYHAAGRPILGSIPGGNLAARIIRRQESGICVDPGSGENWESAAKRLRVSETLRTAMARNARAYAEKEFDIVSIADRFESAFAAALSSKR